MTGSNGRCPVESQHDVEQLLLARTPESRPTPSLRRTEALVELLGQPHRAVPVVHVTGTNGKTSTARMISDVLQAHGFRCGRYTSPHLGSIRERIVIDGEPLDGRTLVELTRQALPVLRQVDELTDVPVSFFEAITALGFLAFADAAVDVAVVEVGMGGAWDATNVADGLVAVVTPVSLDHTEILGSTETAIAEEKSGIIKAGSVAVLAGQRPDVRDVLMRRIRTVGAGVIEIGTDIEVVHRAPHGTGQLVGLRGRTDRYPDFHLPLLGPYQAGNAATAVAAVEAFLSAAGRRSDPERTVAALSCASAPGRLEVIGTAPPVLADASHNPGGMAATMAAVRESFPGREVIVVLAVLGDKDVDGILKVLASNASMIFATVNSSSRCLPAVDLVSRAREVLGVARVHLYGDLASATADACATALGRDAVVLVTGSVVTAADARHGLGDTTVS